MRPPAPPPRTCLMARLFPVRLPVTMPVIDVQTDQAVEPPGEIGRMRVESHSHSGESR